MTNAHLSRQCRQPEPDVDTVRDTIDCSIFFSAVMCGAVPYYIAPIKSFHYTPNFLPCQQCSVNNIRNFLIMLMDRFLYSVQFKKYNVSSKPTFDTNPQSLQKSTLLKECPSMNASI